MFGDLMNENSPTVTLTVKDDNELFMVGTTLAVVAEKLRAEGWIAFESSDQLADVLNAAGAILAKIMVDAYERLELNKA